MALRRHVLLGRHVVGCTQGFRPLRTAAAFGSVQDGWPLREARGQMTDEANGKSMASMPLVSIVIPVFNGREFIEGAIRSVLAQSYPYVECIVVDDGSRDGSGDLALGFGDAVRVIRQENQGQAAALNRGWEVARGEVVGYLSADDLLDDGAVARLVHALEAGRAPAVAFPDYRLIDRIGREIKTVALDFRGYDWMIRRFVCPIGPGALFHKNIIDSTGGWRRDLRQLPDFEFWIRVGRLARFVHLKDVLASFRVHEGSQTFAVADAEKADESVKIGDELTGAGTMDFRLARELRASALVFSACLHFRSGRLRIGFARIMTAFAERPLTVLSVHSIGRLAGSYLSRFRYGSRA